MPEEEYHHMQLCVSVVHGPAALSVCQFVRHLVFVDEQGVAKSDEVDGQDHQCVHVLATLDGMPVGAARFQYTGDYAKVQRVCVLAEHRHHGIGTKIMACIIDAVEAEGRTAKIRLGSQTHALDFYRGLGFKEFGEEYLDAGMPHRDMELMVA